MTPKEILIAARAKIEAPERWTQGKFARAKNGACIGPQTAGAVRWCSIGAIISVGDLPSYDLLLAAIGGEWNTVAEWNDAPNRTHAEVLAAFDRAIATAELEAAPTP